MDAESGKPLMDEGSPVKGETAFTATAPSGSVQVRFSFDARALSGRTLVVFQSLECDGTEIAAHKDIKDEKQSIKVGVEPPSTVKPSPSPPPSSSPTPSTTPAQTPVASPTPPSASPTSALTVLAFSLPVPQTGDDYLILLWIALAGLAVYGVIVCIMLLRRKRKVMAGLIVCAALTVVCAVMAFVELRQYSTDAETYADLERIVIPTASDAETPPESEGSADSETIKPGTPPIASPNDAVAGKALLPAALPLSVDFAALREINPDITGWLVLEDSPISYPIAQ